VNIDGSLWLQDLRLDRDKGASALFRSVEAWQQTFFDEYNRMKGWWSIEGDATALYEAYEDLCRATESPDQRRRLNVLIKPRGYRIRPVGRRESLVRVASRLEPFGFELLGGPPSSLSHPELWQRYADVMNGETTVESRVAVNRAAILLHRLVAESELREFDSSSLDQFRTPLRNVWYFLHEVLVTVLGRH
jgi:hypothetical protein